MPHTDEELSELKSMIQLARKRELNYAICQGKQPPTSIMMIDRKRKPEMLSKLAKKAGDTPKIAFGRISVKGKKVMLTCEKEPPPGLAKKTKQFFRSMDLKMGIVLLDSEGTVLESDVEADEEDEGVTNAAPSQADSQTDDAPDPNEAKWVKASGAVKPLLLKILKAGAGDVSKIRAAWSMATERADGKDFAGAMKVLNRLVPILKEASEGVGADGGNKEAEASIPKDVVPFVKSRLLWIDTRKILFKEMSKLEAAIKSACGDDEALAPVVNEVGSLSERLRVFDESLEATLEKMVEEPDGAGRDALKKTAKEKIGEYAKVLQEDFFKDVDSNNGFVSVSVASTARNALGAIAKTLG